MTNQEILEKVVVHVKGGAQRSVSDNGITCLYRGPNGAKCFVGVLIPDAEYDPRMEGKMVVATAFAPPNLAAHWAQSHGMDLQFLRALQKIHDDTDLEQWLTSLEQLASNWGLSFPAT